MRHAVAPFLGFLSFVVCGASQGEDFSSLPWDLRPYAEFTAENSTVRYATDNAEWDLFVSPTGALAERIGLGITLGDGREITNLELDKGTDSRSRLQSAQGEGVQYATMLPTQHGIAVRHSFYVNKIRPFYVIDVQVTNTGSEPIAISRITPIRFNPGSFAALNPQTRYEERPLALVARWPVYDPDGAPLSVMLRDDASNFTMVMGLMPSGQAASRPRLFQAAGGWQGDVVCEFDPPITVQPGQSLSADPVWICFALPDIEQADILFAWTHSEEPRKYDAQGMLDAWATVPAMEDADALSDAQRAWQGMGIRHALVPDGWEGRPGSLEGGTPRYPTDMSRVAGSIRRTGGIPGLTVDPLVTDGTADYTAVTDAGTRYVNLSTPQGYSHAVERMRRVTSWGYDFFVVTPSSIPDQVLSHFGMTRHQANGLAVRVMEEAAAGKHVYPAPRATLGSDGAAWERADAASQRMYEFSMAIGPVRLNTSDGAYSAEILEIIKNFDGPVEVVGSPSSGARRSLNGLFPRKRNEYMASLPPVSREAQEAIKADQKAQEEAEAEAQRPAEPKKEKEGGFLRNLKDRIVN